MDYWQTIGALAIGAALGFVAEWLKDRKRYEREREASRRDWLRTSIVELITAIVDLYREVDTARDADMIAFQKSGAWPVPASDDVFPQRVGTALNRCKSFAAIVGKDHGALAALRAADALTHVLSANDRADSANRFGIAETHYSNALVQLGGYARNL